MADTVFVNRMPANDTDDTVAYGRGDKVEHVVKRSKDGDENGYPDQVAIEVGEPAVLTDEDGEKKGENGNA